MTPLIKQIPPRTFLQVLVIKGTSIKMRNLFVMVWCMLFSGMDLVVLSKTGSPYHQKTLSNCTASLTGMSYKININLILYNPIKIIFNTHSSLYMVDLTVLKFKLKIIIRSVVDASGGPPISRLNWGPKGRKICLFWKPPPLPQGLHG